MWTERRYLVLSAVVLALSIGTLVDQNLFGDDAWEHIAVVRELAEHPFDPDQPIIGGAEDHAFASPWHLAVGLVAKVTGLSALDAVTLAGVLNVLLVLFAFPRLVRVFTDERHAPFWALLFTLVLWGPSAWIWSGYFHAESLSYGLTYPSTFAFGLACLAIADLAAARHVRAGVLWALIFVIHPLTATFVGVMMVALLVRRQSTRERAWLVGTAVAAVLASFLWPYFSMPELLLGGGGETLDASGKTLYDGLVRPLLPPLLVGLPFLWLRARRDLRDPLLVGAGIMALVAVYGYVGERYVLGRLIAYGLMMVHIATAEGVARFEPQVLRAAPRVRALAIAGAAAVLVVTLAVHAVPAARHAVPGSGSDHAGQGVAPYTSYDRLLAGVREDAVILAPARAAWGIPLTDHRTVAPLHPQAFIDDEPERLADARRFFDGAASAQERAAILRRYDVTAILFDRSALRPQTAAALTRSYRPIGEDGDLVLLAVS